MATNLPSFTDPIIDTSHFAASRCVACFVVADGTNWREIVRGVNATVAPTDSANALGSDANGPYLDLVGGADDVSTLATHASYELVDDLVVVAVYKRDAAADSDGGLVGFGADPLPAFSGWKLRQNAANANLAFQFKVVGDNHTTFQNHPDFGNGNFNAVAVRYSSNTVDHSDDGATTDSGGGPWGDTPDDIQLDTGGWRFGEDSAGNNVNAKLYCVALFDGSSIAFTDANLESLASNITGLIEENATGITGDGAHQAQAASHSGSGGVEVSGSGSHQAQVAAHAGAGGVLVSGSGAHQSQAATHAGSGSISSSIDGSGAHQAEPATHSGSGAVAIAGSGSHQSQVATHTGSGTVGSAPGAPDDFLYALTIAGAGYADFGRPVIETDGTAQTVYVPVIRYGGTTGAMTVTVAVEYDTEMGLTLSGGTTVLFAAGQGGIKYLPVAVAAQSVDGCIRSYLRVASVSAGSIARENGRFVCIRADNGVAPSDTRARFVSKSGSDANAGTAAAPWLTIDHALSNIGAHRELCIGTGTYDEGVNYGGDTSLQWPASRAGLSTSLCIRSHPGQAAKITSATANWLIGGPSGTAGRGDYMGVYDLELEHTGTFAGGGAGLDFRGSGSYIGVFAENCTIHGMDGGDNVGGIRYEPAGTAQFATFYKNTIYDITSGGDSAAIFSYNGRSAYVYGNDLEGEHHAVWWKESAASVLNGIFRCNYMKNTVSPWTVFKLANSNATSMPSKCLLDCNIASGVGTSPLGNTFMNPATLTKHQMSFNIWDGGGEFYSDFITNDGLSIFGNILTDSNACGLERTAANPSSVYDIIDYNVYSNIGNYRYANADYATLALYAAAIGEEANSVEATQTYTDNSNPDIADNDYSFNASQPAYELIPAPSSTFVNAGPYESVGPITAAATPSGAHQAQPATHSGSGSVEVSGSGSHQAQAATHAGSGGTSTPIGGSGAHQAQAASHSGAGVVVDAADSTPDAYSWPTTSGAEPFTLTESDNITLTGINVGAPIAILNGEYSLDDGPYTSASGTYLPGQTIKVRRTSANYGLFAVVTTQIGTVVGQWQLNTRLAPVSTGTGDHQAQPATHAGVGSAPIVGSGAHQAQAATHFGTDQELTPGGEGGALAPITPALTPLLTPDVAS